MCPFPPGTRSPAARTSDNAGVTDHGDEPDPERLLRLLWRVEPPIGRRGPRPRLNVDEIVQAAVETADRDGLAALSMRRVAQRLGGVTAMSLYTYVPDRSTLVTLMVDAVFGELEGAGPTPDSTDWRDALHAAAHHSFALYQRHPWLLRVNTGRAVLGPHTVARYDQQLRILAPLPLTDLERDLVITAVDDYVHGAARGSVDVAEEAGRSGLTDVQWWQRYGPALAEVLAPDTYPLAARVGATAGAAYQAPRDPGAAFDFGLARLLDGVAALVAERSDGHPGGGPDNRDDARP